MCQTCHKIDEKIIIFTKQRIGYLKMRNNFAFICLTLVLVILILEYPSKLKAEDMPVPIENSNSTIIGTEDPLTQSNVELNNEERVGKQFWPMLPR